MESKNKENKINLEELIVKQLDWLLELKNRDETKSIGYLTAITLMMTILAQFSSEIYKMNIISTTYRKLILLFYGIVFCFGVVILLLCAIQLLRKNIHYFNVEKLINLRKNENEYDDNIINAVSTFIKTNKSTHDVLNNFNKIISVCVIILVGLFSLSGFIYFVTIIGGGIK
ncbi:MAG: hypothetical protein IKQ61_01520 [Spirochaetales bacterium]|nr:hypothetical protein [Spirochaetales bacterium]